MDTFTANITIYNHRYDGRDIWVKTHIKGASWYGGQKITVGENGYFSANTYTVRIPESNLGDFVLPEDYIGEKWTVQSGDIIVLGLIDKEIAKSSDLDNISQKFVVTGCHNNTNAVLLKHLKIEGK